MLLKMGVGGLIIGYGAANTGSKCICENCSALKFGDFSAYREFSGELDGFKIVSDENNMIDVLTVLGDSFRASTSGIPILKWQDEIR